MIKVTKTKKVSIKQMRIMGRNLHEKYGDVFLDFRFCFLSQEKENFWLNSNSFSGEFVSSWEELQERYEQLMKGINYDSSIQNTYLQK